MGKGKLIVLEGIDGSGKSTLARAVLGMESDITGKVVGDEQVGKVHLFLQVHQRR